MSARRPVALAALLIASLAAASACQRGPTTRLDFVLKDAIGRDVNFAAFKGKPLVVNFWATWCGPCKVETPYLEALWQKYKDQGLTIVGIETDSEPEAIQAFANQYKVTFPLVVGVERQDVGAALGWGGILPTSVLIRADGTIAGRIVGLKTEEYWAEQVKALF